MTRPAPRPCTRTLTRDVAVAPVEVDPIELAALRAEARAGRLLVELLAERRRIGRNHVPLKVLQRAARGFGLHVS
jgi:hypothetical protein